MNFLGKCFVLYGLVLHIQVVFINGQNPGEPLFLTPYINSGQIIEAKRISAVENLPFNVESYSGLITVDEANGAHTFFWFFPAANNPESAPVLLWSEGGPGVSTFFSVFVEHGPFSIGDDGNLKQKEITWTQNHSIIYMDQPNDVGYSFTDLESGYVSSGAECAPNVHNFLLQFFTLFPEYKSNDFYNGGVSYGGIFAPEIAHYIHTKNNENPEIMINLKGVLLETPWVDPRTQIVYGEFLYHTGLISDTQRDHFLTEESRIHALIDSESYLEGQDVFEELFFGGQQTYYKNVTGYDVKYNILKDKPSPSDDSWIEVVTTAAFRNAIHVGNLTFTPYSTLVQQLFRPNILKGTKSLVENLLDSGYKVLMYSGQLDIITNHIGVDQMMKNLDWSGAQEYNNAPRTIWKVDDRVAGYAKTARNLTQVMVTNAGHGSAEEQPKNVFELLNKFTGDIPFY